MNLSVPFHLLIDMKYEIEKQKQKIPRCMYILLKNLEGFLILSTFPNYFVLRNPVTSFLVYTTGIYILPLNTRSQMKTLFLVPNAYSIDAEKIRNVYSFNES